MTEPSGASKTVTAADVPSEGPSSVQADLDALFAATSGLVIIDSAAKLEAEFPAVAGVHTVNKQTQWVEQGGAPIDITPNTIDCPYPGSIGAVGRARVTIIGNSAGPLISGELVVSGINILNTGAGDDILVSSLSGRFVAVEAVLLGDSAGRIESVTGGGTFTIVHQPAAPGATGLVIDGVNGVHLWAGCLFSAPGGVAYVAMTIEPTAIVAVDLRIQDALFIGSLATDALLRIDPLATLPTGPLPTNIVGFEVLGCAIKNGSQLFDSTGLDQTDIRILSDQNTGGPTSQFIGDAIADTTATPAPSPILQTHAAPGPAWEVVPSDNAPTVAPNDVVLTLTLPISQRHSVQITSRQVWSMRYDGPENARTAAVSWKASADRGGGAAAIVSAQLEYDNGGGWLPLPATADTITLASGDPQDMGGRTVVPDTDSGFQLRLVSKTDTIATVTRWHSFEVSKGI